MLIDNKFEIGDCVYLTTDNGSLARVVTGFRVTQNQIIYYVAQGIHETCHYDYELSKERICII